MSRKINVSTTSKNIKGAITLTGSKSIANRALLIRALCEGDFKIENLSASDDTITMDKLLNSSEEILDCHHAGTTYRFLTAYLATQDNTKILTGSARMKQRPIGPLVEALRSIGANIDYMENDGFPPLKINPPKQKLLNLVKIKGDISSQYLSALLMVAPTLPNGLTLEIVGDLVSLPYLQMTLNIMGYFGIEHQWDDNKITVLSQKYIPKDFFVEADWSAASYFYGIATLADSADITLHGLEDVSLQGDSAIALIGEHFNIKSTFDNRSVRLVKASDTPNPLFFEHDFIMTPDIAQTVFAMCAGVGTSGLFTGLKTLYIKETDRIKAFQIELAKLNVFLSKVPDRFKKNSKEEYFMQDGSAKFNDKPVFDTYHDHRMAMSLAPLALKGDIAFNDPDVVSKSYPAFWKDLTELGFEIVEVEN